MNVLNEPIDPSSSCLGNVLIALQTSRISID